MAEPADPEDCGPVNAGPAGRRPGRVFSIPPGATFLATLARALVDGRLIEGFRPLDDPLLLPTATIYLPTRRAARALSAEIIDAMGVQAALLPTIRTLGDSDDDEFELGAAGQSPADLALPIGRLDRHLHLAVLVRGWTNAMAAATRQLFGDEDIAIPSSAAEAVRMAGDLARLLDAMETEEIPWDALPALAGESAPDGRGERWAEWWNLTLHFLTIVTRHWPDFLADKGRPDPSQHRRMLLDARTRQLIGRGAHGPVIAAGSTGSIPATARLIAAIAGRADGAVVLPGLDRELDDAIWRSLGEPDAADTDMALCTHPQYALARLLRAMSIDRADVIELGEDAAWRARMRLIARALLPARATFAWAGAAGDVPIEACDGLTLVEAPGERMEALAIAVAMRETLETPGRTAALVTPDRALARRVCAEMRRFGIALDDSAGSPLRNAPPTQAVRLLLAVCIGPADPVALAALIKHPLLAGASDEGASRIARLFELAVLRGAVTTPPAGALGDAVEAARGGGDPFAPAEVKVMSDEDWHALLGLARRLDAGCAPLQALRNAGGRVGLDVAMAALRLAFERILGASGIEGLARHAAGPQLQALFDGFCAAGPAGFDLAPDELPQVFDALIAEETVRDARAHHPRLAVYGPLEARLQRADRMILAGLNEGAWPGLARNDPFLNRPMRAEIGLSLPERRIGQAAHDFQQLGGHEEVIYTRSLKADNAPTVASRWLQRLAVVAGEDATGQMRARGDRLLALADSLDRPSGAPSGRIARPNPAPPLALRPTGLSITEIETWIRDPYAIHARHVLGLSPLPPLERDADPLLKGRIYHDILSRFVGARPKGALDTSVEMDRMMAIAGEVFGENNVPSEVAATWLPRFRAIARLFIEWEAGRQGAIARSLTEISGRMEVGETGFTLRGRADRIDMLRDGTLAVLDYKSGLKPSKKQARTLSPQLSLEAMMARSGAFDPLPAGHEASDLAYVRLRPADSLVVDRICEGRDAPEPAVLVEAAWRQLNELILAYRDPAQGYVSRYAPAYEGDLSGDYDHLARVREWATGDGEGGDE